MIEQGTLKEDKVLWIDASDFDSIDGINNKAGFSIVFSIELVDAHSDGSCGFIFSSTIENICAFIKNEELFFTSIVDKDKDKGVCSVKIEDLLNKKVTIFFIREDFISLNIFSIYVNEEMVASKTLPMNNNTAGHIFALGSDENGENKEKFRLFEQVAYGKKLIKKEIKELYDYFNDKYYQSCLNFDGSTHLIRDILLDKFIMDKSLHPVYIELKTLDEAIQKIKEL